MEFLIYSLIFMPMAAAILSYLLGRRSKTGRDLFFRLVLAMEFMFSIFLFFCPDESGILSLNGICGMGLHFTLDGFRKIYVVGTCPGSTCSTTASRRKN